MKNLKMKKLITLILSTTILLNFILPLSATEPTQTFSGVIVSDTDVNLAGIEVKIYSAEPIYDEESNLLFYAETYEYSVYTDSSGKFTFTKPSAYCSYTINIESLPPEYGVSKHTQFILPSRNNDTIMAAPLSTAEVAIDGNNVTVTFEDINKNPLYAAYEIISNNNSTSNNSNTQNMDLDPYTDSGIIVTKGKTFTYSMDYNISESSDAQKLIGEENVYSIMGDIPTYDNYFDIEITAAEGGPYCFRVFYQNSYIKADYKTYIANTLKGLYRTFVVTNSFTAPPMYTGSDRQYFPIYIIEDNDSAPMDTDKPGLTRKYYNDNNSAIIIREYPICYSQTEIIAHEFMHAIMRAYTNWNIYLPNWYKESFADLAAIIYCNEAKGSIEDHIKVYKQNCDKSITYTGEELSTFCYGTVLYPLYIYSELGGWQTVREIFSNYSTYNNPFLAISSVPWISSYSSAFAAMAGYNYNTGKYYEQYDGDLWGDVKQQNRHLVHSFENSVNPMSSQYELYNSAGHDMTLTLEITCGNTSGLIYKKICESSTGDTTISTIMPSTNRITVTNFGDSDCENLILAVVNTVYTNSTVEYEITPNLS